MAAAARTPGVRFMTVCDRVRESNTEAGVYHLRGLRQSIVMQVFPFVANRLWLFLVLESSSGKLSRLHPCARRRDGQSHLLRTFGAGPLLRATRANPRGRGPLAMFFPPRGRYTVQTLVSPTS
jgi:hypothetical protein